MKRNGDGIEGQKAVAELLCVRGAALIEAAQPALQPLGGRGGGGHGDKPGSPRRPLLAIVTLVASRTDRRRPAMGAPAGRPRSRKSR